MHFSRFSVYEHSMRSLSTSIYNFDIMFCVYAFWIESIHFRVFFIFSIIFLLLLVWRHRFPFRAHAILHLIPSDTCRFMFNYINISSSLSIYRRNSCNNNNGIAMIILCIAYTSSNCMRCSICQRTEFFVVVLCHLLNFCSKDLHWMRCVFDELNGKSV